MDTTTSQSIHSRLAELATTDLTEFRSFFKRLRKLSPEQAAEAFLEYIAAHGPDTPAQSMVFWLSGDTTYVSVLLDPEALSPELAKKAICVVKEMDPLFLSKFVKLVSDLTSPPVIVRALGLLSALKDYSILIPWLRQLSQHSDLHVRSRSAKLLCELRPSKSLIERQMHSDDARVRASAIEVLWNSNSEDARSILYAALDDPHHRVVSNALVGLYLRGEKQMLDRMVELCAHKDQLFRAAMAWAIGFVKDPRAIPTLQELMQDRSAMVRKRASTSLLVMESLLPVVAATSVVEPPEAEPEVMPEAAPEESVPTVERPLDLFMFR